MKIVAVILAAGASTRMGRDKALLPWPEQPGDQRTLLGAVVASAGVVAPKCFVVCGRNHSEIAAEFENSTTQLLVNGVPQRGMFSSLQIGVRAALIAGADAVFVLHVDRPPVSASTMRKLALSAQVRSLDESFAIVPTYQGKHGHPYLLSKGLMREFLSAPDTSNARDLMHEKGTVHYFDCDDPAVLVNMNTVDDYRAVTTTPTRS